MNPVKKDKEKKDNYLATAEMSVEGNYNQIDGIINNVPKPSFLEQLKEYERLIDKNKKGDTDPNGGKLEKSRLSKDEL
jgi:hypothetical protein